MHDADLIVCVGARFDDRVTGRLDGFAPRARKSSTSTSTRRRSTRWCGRRGAGRRLRRGACSHAAGSAAPAAPAASRAARSSALVGADRALARRATAWRFDDAPTRSLPQALMSRAAARTCDGRRRDRLDRRRPAPDVGRAVPSLRPAQPLADLRRRRHDGLRPARGDRRADRASRRAGGLRERRRVDPDEHPGTVDRRAARHAGEGRAVEQRLHGHGAPVAGTEPRRPLQPQLHRGAAGFRRRWPAPSAGRRAARRPPAPNSTTRWRECLAFDGPYFLDVRVRRAGELLPDDSGRRAATATSC